MSKRREQPADEVDESIVETLEVEQPEPEPIPDTLPFPTYPPALRMAAIGAYERAKASGMLDGDALASGRRVARRIARENNMRFPE